MPTCARSASSTSVRALLLAKQPSKDVQTSALQRGATATVQRLIMYSKDLAKEEVRFCARRRMCGRRAWLTPRWVHVRAAQIDVAATMRNLVHVAQVLPDEIERLCAVMLRNADVLFTVESARSQLQEAIR